MGNSTDFQPYLYLSKLGIQCETHQYFFQCSLCLWDAASKSLVLPRMKNYKMFTPRLSPLTPGEPAPCFILGSGGPKPPPLLKTM